MKTKLAIFGVTGDLSRRYLLPALSRIRATGQFGDLSIIGISRRDVELRDVLGDHFGHLHEVTSLVTMDMGQASEFERLRDSIALQPDEQLLFYLSVPPDASGPIIENLGQVGLNGDNVKLLLEKPFGTDLASAKEALGYVATYFDESHVYRIDHYLAKEMAQNILTLRGRNALFAHIWNKEAIERIEVLALESIDIEGRVHFYEQTGALRDFLQGHLLQLLSLVLLPLPEDLDWTKLADCRQIALDQLRPIDPDHSVRAQYVGYRQEVDNPRSTTETFLSVLLHSDDPNWQGVPLAITTGKALNRKKTEIRVHLRKTNEAQSNFVIFRLYPNEGIEIDLVTKKPGYERELEDQQLTFLYPEGTQMPNAYEQVIVDAVHSQKSLFASGAEVLRAWEIVAPLQQAWAQNADGLRLYARGSKAKSIIE